MCEKCQEIEARIQHWLSSKAIDSKTVESLKAHIVELQRYRAAIEHPVPSSVEGPECNDRVCDSAKLR
jgi:hypothetical protein